MFTNSGLREGMQALTKDVGMGSNEQVEAFALVINSAMVMTQDQREECVEMEQPVEAVKEETSLWTHVVRGVKAAGRLTLGLLVPLGILAATLPISYEHQARGSCMDTFWSPALSLIEPPCTMTYLTPLPV
ncbi:hypothetical protein DPEC_G00218740 [Dallia pectoralis]|uniref:Uncharacterized protein n=1 Tax=Dallia pectoralis TaxID=75939 RepID=A0ACC2G3H4_DALPE|nr:hypothetical protein DPEC_G00218740 [Dallia pectoralis]